jgi:hypothetical protein
MPSQTQIQSFTNLETCPNVELWSITMSISHLYLPRVMNCISVTPRYSSSVLFSHSFESGKEGKAAQEVKKIRKIRKKDE